MEHVIYIMKNILVECCQEKSGVKEFKPAGIVCIEQILLTICRYIRFLEASGHTMTVKGKLCQLMEIV